MGPASEASDRGSTREGQAQTTTRLRAERGVARGVALALALPLAVGCGRGTSRAIEDARRPTVASDAAATDTAVRPHARTDAASAPRLGDLAIRVEWIDVPARARSSPGPTRCGTPAPPAVAPTTTWGIPDAIVLVDGLARDPGEAWIRVTDCVAAPVVALASSIVVESGTASPVRLDLRDLGATADLTAAPRDRGTRALQLPIAGHAVRASLEPDSRNAVALKGEREAVAWIVRGAGAITDASGVAAIPDVPPGRYRVRAWLPPRGGQPGLTATAEVDVSAGDLVEHTLTLR